MLSTTACACLCGFVNAGFMFGTFCLVLTQAVQAKQFPNKIEERVSECFVLMVAWGLAGALCHCGRVLARVIAHLCDNLEVYVNKHSILSCVEEREPDL